MRNRRCLILHFFVEKKKRQKRKLEQGTGVLDAARHRRVSKLATTVLYKETAIDCLVWQNQEAQLHILYVSKFEIKASQSLRLLSSSRDHLAKKMRNILINVSGWGQKMAVPQT